MGISLLLFSCSSKQELKKRDFSDYALTRQLIKSIEAGNIVSVQKVKGYIQIPDAFSVKKEGSVKASFLRQNGWVIDRVWIKHDSIFPWTIFIVWEHPSWFHQMAFHLEPSDFTDPEIRIFFYPKGRKEEIREIIKTSNDDTLKPYVRAAFRRVIKAKW